MEANIFYCLLLLFLSKDVACEANKGCLNSVRPQLMRSEIFGSTLEPTWDDDIANQSPPVVAIRSIRIAGTSHSVILSIQVTYERQDGTLYVTPRRGDFATTFQVTDITLAQDECIVQVQGVVNLFNNPVQFSFETRRTNGTIVTYYGPFGTGTGISFSIEGIILGFFGRATTAISGIGFDYQSLDFGPTTTDSAVATTNSPSSQGCLNPIRPQLMRSEIFGSTLEPTWDDDIANQSPPVVAVRSIRIAGTSHSVILSIQVTYERQDGTLYVTPRRGDFATTFQVTDITLAQDECIVHVQGVIRSFSGGTAVRPVQLVFETTRADGTTATYGPFGTGTGVPFSVKGIILGFFGRATTSISGIGFHYQSLDFSPTTVTGKLSNLINIFSNLTTETYEAAMSRLSQVIELSENNTNEQNSEVLNAVANYTSGLATFVGDLNVILNKTVVQDMTQVVSSLLQWNPTNITAASSSSVLQSFEKVVSRYAQQLSLNQNETITTPSLIIVAELRTIESFTDKGQSFAISGSSLLLDQTTPGRLSPQEDATIRLPPSLFEILNNHARVGVFFGRYETTTLFPIDSNSEQDSRQTQVGSQVLAATVGQNLHLQNLSEPITVIFKLQNQEGLFMAPGSQTCVSWDFNLHQWTTKGCNTSLGQGGIITCRCNHLTNFAVLVDVCTRQADCEPITKHCEAEVIRSETGTIYSWPQTAEGNVANFSCPLSPMVTVSRHCGVGSVWHVFNEEACGVVNEQLNRLNNSFNNLTSETVEIAVASLAQVVEQTEAREVEQNGAVLTTVANYFTELAEFVNSSNVTINSMVIANVAQAMNTLLQWNPENIAIGSSSRVVQSFEVVVYLFAQQLSVNETQNITLNSLTVVAEFQEDNELHRTFQSLDLLHQLY